MRVRASSEGTGVVILSAGERGEGEKDEKEDGKDEKDEGESKAEGEGEGEGEAGFDWDSGEQNMRESVNFMEALVKTFSFSSFKTKERTPKHFADFTEEEIADWREAYANIWDAERALKDDEINERTRTTSL